MVTETGLQESTASPDELAEKMHERSVQHPKQEADYLNDEDSLGSGR